MRNVHQTAMTKVVARQVGAMEVMMIIVVLLMMMIMEIVAMFTTGNNDNVFTQVFGPSDAASADAANVSSQIARQRKGKVEDRTTSMMYTFHVAPSARKVCASTRNSCPQ